MPAFFSAITFFGRSVFRCVILVRLHFRRYEGRLGARKGRERHRCPNVSGPDGSGYVV